MTTLRVGRLRPDGPAGDRGRFLIFTHAWHDADGNLRVDVHRYRAHDADKARAAHATLLSTLDQQEKTAA